jgi:putative heme-binding domain-containing protein
MQSLQTLLSDRGVSLTQVIEDTTRQARQMALDQSLGQQQRVEAIRLLRMGQPNSMPGMVSELLGLIQSPEIKRAAIELASSFETVEIGEAILARFSELSPVLRSRALQVLLARKNWTRQLVVQIESGSIPPVLIDATARQRLVRNQDPSIGSRAKEVFGGQSGLNRDDLVQRYMTEVDTLAGNVEKGRKLFRKSCAACHRLENVGNEIGPNLAAFANRGTAAMITNILDPNREVDPRFLSYQIQLQDGRTLLGVIFNETASTIGLRDSEGKTVAILREEIEALKSTTLSLMPENFENELNPQAMSDLIKYLLSQGS